MPLVIEEMTGDVVPTREPDGERGDDARRAPSDAELRKRIRDTIACERRQAERLCDR